MFDNRKTYEEPALDVIKLIVADVITTSSDNQGGENGGGTSGDTWGTDEF